MVMGPGIPAKGAFDDAGARSAWGGHAPTDGETASSAGSPPLAGQPVPMGGHEGLHRIGPAINPSLDFDTVMNAENARLFQDPGERPRVRVQQLESLFRLGRAAGEKLSLEEVMQRAVEEGIRALDADRYNIATVDWPAGVLTVRAAHDRRGDAAASIGRGLSLAESPGTYRVLSRGEPMVLRVEDPRLPPLERRLMQDLGATTCIVAPLVAGRRAIGITTCARRAGRPAFTEEEVFLAQAIAGHVAGAMENARLFQEITAQQARTEALLSSMKEGMYATDLEGRITAVNPSLERLVGRKAVELVGQLCQDVLGHTEEDGTPLCEGGCPRRAVLTEEKSSEAGMLFTRTAWGERLPTAMSVAPIRDESGKAAGVVALVRDVTREWQVSKLRANIISVVSHEFRTPLTSLIGFSELLLTRDQTPEERRICHEQIHSEALRLEALVNDFLDMSRLDANRVVLNLEPVMPADAIQRGLREVARLAGQRRLASIVETDLPTVRADPDRLGQILGNLLTNAIKYSPEGTTITVRARRAGGEADLGEKGLDGWVVFTVEDQGIGIPADLLTEVFTPFYRVEGQATRAARGSGLGLSIVKSLVDLHGGRVWVESRMGEGSRFHVALRAIS